jgi:hypothetical protein
MDHVKGFSSYFTPAGSPAEAFFPGEPSERAPCLPAPPSMDPHWTATLLDRPVKVQWFPDVKPGLCRFEVAVSYPARDRLRQEKMQEIIGRVNAAYQQTAAYADFVSHSKRSSDAARAAAAVAQAARQKAAEVSEAEDAEAFALIRMEANELAKEAEEKKLWAAQVSTGLDEKRVALERLRRAELDRACLDAKAAAKAEEDRLFAAGPNGQTLEAFALALCAARDGQLLHAETVGRHLSRDL